MSFACKLALLGATIFVAAAQPASALTVESEATGNNCSSVTFSGHGPGVGGCAFVMTGTTMTELGTPLGMSLCDTQFRGRLGGNGQGFIYSFTIVNCNSTGWLPCNESTIYDNWPLGLTSETSAEMHLCVALYGFLTVNCHLTGIHVNQLSHTDIEVYTTGHQSCESGGGTSVEGHWHIAPPFLDPGMEVVD